MRPLSAAFTLLMALATAAPAQDDDYQARLDRGRNAAERKEWDVAAQQFGLALRVRPDSVEAGDLFRQAIREVEIYNTRFEPLRTRTAEHHGGQGGLEGVALGLAWLAAKQQPEGYWVNEFRHDYRCDDVGTTAFALLAFLADGNSDATGPYREQVARGVAWLIARQQAGGSFGGGSNYSEGLAALAIVEAFAMGGSEQSFLSAQKSLNHIVASRCPEGGWDYQEPPAISGHGDVSVSGMMFQPLKQAQLAYLDFSYDTLDEIVSWVDRITPESGIVPYRPGQNSSFHDPSMVAIGSLFRLYAGHTPESHASLARGIGIVSAAREDMRGNIYFLYYGTMVSFLVGGETWTAWNEVLVENLLAKQVAEGPDKGRFWDEADRWTSPRYVDPVTYQAMAILSLECCYRYVPRKMVPGGD